MKLDFNGSRCEELDLFWSADRWAAWAKGERQLFSDELMKGIGVNQFKGALPNDFALGVDDEAAAPTDVGKLAGEGLGGIAEDSIFEGIFCQEGLKFGGGFITHAHHLPGCTD